MKALVRPFVIAVLVWLAVWALLYSTGALAGTLTLTAKTVTGNGYVTPELTWVTSPVAATCTASGNWTGAKNPAGGTETLPVVNTSRTYTMVCGWNDGQAVVSWVNPTQRTDGTAYTNPKESKINYGTSATALTQSVTVPTPGATKTITPLTSGTWYFTVQAVDLAGVPSDPSSVVSKVITQGTDTETVTITVNPIPLPPTNVTVQ